MSQQSQRSVSESPRKIELPTGLPVGTVNVYFFDNPVPTLIDTGIKSTESENALRKSLAELGYTVADLARVIVSHPHIDHFGLAAKIAEESHAEIWVFNSTIPWLIDYPKISQARHTFYAETLFPKLGLSPDVAKPILDNFYLLESAADAIPQKYVRSFGAGDSFNFGGNNWQVLHTPGHSSQLTCFYQPDTRQFLSTDMLLKQTPTPIIEASDDPDGYTPSLQQFLTSLEKIDALDIETVYPGHGEIFSDPHALITHQKNRIQNRKTECLQLLQSGFDTVEAILLQMYPHYPPAFRFAALWMLVGYLDILRAENKILRIEKNKMWYYHPT